MARTLVIDTIEAAGRTFDSREELIVIKGKYNAVINFYRSVLNSEDNFGKKDTGYSGEFGFDRFNEKVMGEGLIEKYKNLASVETKKEAIKDNHSYFCAYLSIWPPNVNGNSDPKNPKHIVDVFVKAEENNTKKEATDITTEQVEFESSDPSSVSIDGSDAKGIKKLSLTIGATAQAMKINCIKSFSSEITITAKAQGYVIGKLIIYPNATRYKTVIQPVKLNFKGVEGKTVTKIPHTSFFTNLVQDFNTKAFNQAYIYGELAPQTHVIDLSKNQFFNPKMLSSKTDQNTGKSDIYLKKDAEDDGDTKIYNDLVENRYAALLSGQTSQNKAEENLKEKIQNLLVVFDKHYSYRGGNSSYTERQHKKKIVTKAWNEPDVIKAKADYDSALIAFNNTGTTSGLNKEHTIHLFYSHDIYAARNPLNKVLAYSYTGYGVVHIFEAALINKAANPTVLHEIGHSLGLQHTFAESLGKYAIKVPGTIYKEDLEEEIEKLENEVKSKEEQLKSLEQGGELLRMLNFYYLQIQRDTQKKEWFLNLANDLQTNFIDIVKKAKSFESKSLGANTNSSEISKIKIDIQRINNLIDTKKIQRKTAIKRDDFPKYKNQSKTDENYMDYHQDTNGNENKSMERKVFYKWQWDEMCKTGIEGKYLQKEK
ncbi:hypothetical protein SAMN04488096_10724 [Mesonia phycicola]|uniref:Uncharacterized protein n=2 Tax=Mesonia phycicola TaxID=579105 RepID=A0A1M6FYH3_9FLAO|nr:hypothetical protein [Mesonia phycicola]SHJ02756.1 hypothetical protein SAMN04488096_10724 [Mesonia phycicola]